VYVKDLRTSRIAIGEREGLRERGKESRYKTLHMLCGNIK
jgi:hypothetical protein